MIFIYDVTAGATGILANNTETEHWQINFLTNHMVLGLAFFHNQKANDRPGAPLGGPDG
jgi:hypothetical protein